MKILLVGCNKEVFKRAEKVFEGTTSQVSPTMSYRYSLLIAEGAQAALESIDSSHPDLVMISQSLGLDESKDLCQEIRESEGKRHIGILFLLDGSEDDDTLAVECLEVGADDVIKHEVSEREVLARTNAVLKLKAMTDELRSANHRLHQLSYTDELTGLNNMRAFNGKYSKAVKECLNGNAGLGVIMMDLDNFKAVNDNTNHLMGSHVISEVGKLIRGSGILGDRDCAARFGGDEYVIFTLDESLAEVRRKGEQIRELVHRGIFIKDGNSIKITTSIGVAWAVPGYRGKAEDPIKAADMMLYASKHEGRNRVSSMELKKAADLDCVKQHSRIEVDLEEVTQDPIKLAK